MVDGFTGLCFSVKGVAGLDGDRILKFFESLESNGRFSFSFSDERGTEFKVMFQRKLYDFSRR